MAWHRGLAAVVFALAASRAAVGQNADLLKTIDPARDRVAGDWMLTDGKLIGIGVKGDRSSRLQIPFAPKGEYQVTVTAKKVTEGPSDLLIGLAAASRQFFVAVGPKGGGISLGGIIGNEYEVQDAAHSFAEPVTTVCAVTRQGVFVWVDGKKFLEYRGDPRKLTVNDKTAVPRKDALFLGIGNDGRWEITEVKVGPPVGVPEAKKRSP